MGRKSKDADFVQFKENLVKVYFLLSGVPRLEVAKIPQTGKGFLLVWEVVLNETQDPSNAKSLKAEGTSSRMLPPYAGSL